MIFTDSMSVLQGVRSAWEGEGGGPNDKGNSGRIRKIGEALLEREKQNRKGESENCK